MRSRIPRAAKGQAISAAAWNALVDAIERADSWQFDASSGLQATEGGKQRRISFAATDTKLYVSLTQALPAGDGVASLGHGKGKVMTFQPGDGTAAGSLVVPSDAVAEDIYNVFNTSFKSGATVIAFRTGDGSLQLDNTLCSNANTGS